MYAGSEEAKNDLAMGRIDVIHLVPDGASWSIWLEYGSRSNVRFLGEPLGTCEVPIFRRKFQTLKAALAVVDDLVGDPPYVSAARVSVWRPAEGSQFGAAIKPAGIEAELA